MQRVNWVRWLVNATKALVATVLMGLILWGVDWEGVIRATVRMNGYMVSSALIAFMVFNTVEVVRLRVALKVYGLTWWQLWRLHLVGSLFSQVAPGGIGGDAYKIVSLGSGQGSVVQTTVLILLTRSVGFAVSMVAALIVLGLYSASGTWPEVARGWWTSLSRATVGEVLAVTLGIGMLMVVLAMFVWRLRIFDGLLRSVRVTVKEIHPGQILALVVWSVVALVMRVAVLIFLVHSLEAHIAPSEATLVVVLATLGSMLPVSLAGLGVREGIVIGLLIVFGLIYEEAVIVALMGRVFLYLLPLAGGLWFMGTMRSQSRPQIDHSGRKV